MKMIIDIHTHCFPDHIAKKAVAELSKCAGGHPFFTDGTVSGLKSAMQNSGVDISVIQNIATKPAQTHVVNAWAAGIREEGIVSFGTLHPEYPAYKEEISFLKDANIPGVKFHPDYQGFFVDEKRMYPVYEALMEAGLIILFHAGVDIGLSAPYKCMPQKLKKVLQDIPGLKIIAAHMGGYDCWDDVEKHLVGEDVYFDTSYSLVRMEMPRMKNMILQHGFEKVLFGSDSPWTNQKEEADKIRALGLSAEQTEALLSGNSKRLLNIT